MHRRVPLTDASRCPSGTSCSRFRRLRHGSPHDTLAAQVKDIKEHQGLVSTGPACVP